MARLKTSAAREAKRNESLWRPMADGPDADTTVLLLIKPDDDEPYVASAYWAGSRWRSAIGDGHVGGHKAGWMHMHEAVQALSAKRGKAEQETDVSLRDPYAEGHDAYIAGLPETDNPFEVTTDDHLLWNDGWMSAEDKYDGVLPAEGTVGNG